MPWYDNWGWASEAEITGRYRPSADESMGGWIPSTGSVLAECIDEVSANDTDFISSPNLTNSTIMSLSPTLPAGSWEVSVRGKVSENAAELRVRFLDPSSVDVGGSSWQVLSTTYTTYVLPVITTATADRFRIELR